MWTASEFKNHYERVAEFKHWAPYEDVDGNFLVNLKCGSYKEFHNYREFFQSTSNWLGIFNLFFKALSCIFLSIFYQKRSLKHLNGNMDFIFVSHLNSPKDEKNPEDLYFGNIINAACEKSGNVLVVRINHLSKFKRLQTKKFSDKGTTYINLPRFCKTSQETQFLFLGILKIVKGFWKLREIKDEKQRRLFSYLLTGEIHQNTISGFRYAKLLKTILDNSKVKNVVITWEGHGWEKILVSELSKMKKEAFVTGYVHSLTYPYPTSVFQAQNSHCLPKRLLCAGKRSLRHAQLFAPNISSENIGSPKAISSKKKNIKADRTCVLFAPEGILDETEHFLFFASNFAKHSPEIHVVIRLHRIFEEQRAFFISKYSLNNISNIEISCDALSTDLERSNFVVYRGSSVCVSAASHGCKLIFLEIDGDHLLSNPLAENKGIGVANSLKMMEKLTWLEELDQNKEELNSISKDVFSTLNTKKFLRLCN